MYHWQPNYDTEVNLFAPFHRNGGAASGGHNETGPQGATQQLGLQAYGNPGHLGASPQPSPRQQTAAASMFFAGSEPPAYSAASHSSATGTGYDRMEEQVPASQYDESVWLEMALPSPNISLNHPGLYTSGDMAAATSSSGSTATSFAGSQQYYSKTRDLQSSTSSGGGQLPLDGTEGGNAAPTTTSTGSMDHNNVVFGSTFAGDMFSGSRPPPLPRVEDASPVPVVFKSPEACSTGDPDSPVCMATRAMAKLQARDSATPIALHTSPLGSMTPTTGNRSPLSRSGHGLPTADSTGNRSPSSASTMGNNFSVFVPSGASSPESMNRAFEAAITRVSSSSAAAAAVAASAGRHSSASLSSPVRPPLNFGPESSDLDASLAAFVAASGSQAQAEIAAATAAARATFHGTDSVRRNVQKAVFSSMQQAAGSEGEGALDGGSYGDEDEDDEYYGEDEQRGAGGRRGKSAGSGSGAGRALSAKRRSTVSRMGGPRKRVMGWCLACAQPKELEERTTRDRERKFQVCNACRKTHLTNRIVPDTARAMEQLARLYNIGEDSELLLRLVHCELIKLYSDTRISRILTLWLNTDLTYVPVTLVCDANLDELRRLPVRVRDRLRRGEGPGYNVEYIQICGQTYWCHHLHIPASVLNDFNNAVVDELCLFINREIESKLVREPDFKEALLGANIEVQNLAVTRSSVKVLYELQQ